MDHIISRESDFVVDLESCRSTSDEAGSLDSPLDVKIGDVFFASVCNGDDDELSKAENGLTVSSNLKDGNVRVIIDKGSVVEKKGGKEKRKTMSAKKPPKPPRPPRGYSLDAADQKLIKEIAELAMLKRARIERMKALKKLKEAKMASSTSSSAFNGSFLALLFTVFFFFVLLFQGMSCRSSAVSFQGSPQSDRIRGSRFVIVQDHSNLPTVTSNIAESGFSNLVEQAPGLSHGDSPKSVVSSSAV